MPKVFISSTSLDLIEHRRRLMETLHRMELDGVAMEAFGAEPDAPVQVCRRKVEEADALVLVLAHRYGWIPSVEQGGDGVSSITRIEFNQARHPNHGPPKPVFAFLVDEQAEWAAGREQDALVDAASPEQALHIYAAVQALKRFKSELNDCLVRDTFTTPADLADRAGSAIARWLLAQSHVVQRNALVERELQELLEKVAEHLRQGLHDLALTYLEESAKTANSANLPAIADKRLEIVSSLSLNDARLIPAAQSVRALQGKQQTLAELMLGKAKSQRARRLWDTGERDAAWAMASEARGHLVAATTQDPLNPDAFGSLGGLLKRMATWALERCPGDAPALEDAMLAAYKTGWERVPDAYPLLNYIEQRAVIAEQRNPTAPGPELIGAQESELRAALQAALKTREGQLKNEQDRPWAAFDLARGYHYLNPNVPGFLEDLTYALREARSVARSADDRYMVTTTCDSLRALLRARVKLEGLAEGIELLQSAVVSDSWYSDRPRRTTPFLGPELAQLQATLTDFADQQLRLSARQAERVSVFIKATELRWSRDDEERFQQEIEGWKRALEPRERKVMRALWKVFGSKAFDALTGGVIPVDWDEAVALITK